MKKCDKLKQVENPIEWGLYYDKSEADKVIAEKDAKILALDAEVFKQKHHAKLFFDERNYAETQLLQQKHKRCLALAEMCSNACNKWMMKKANAIGLGKDGVEYYLKARWKVSHYMRWQKYWLELAEKFKPNKSTLQQKD